MNGTQRSPRPTGVQLAGRGSAGHTRKPVPGRLNPELGLARQDRLSIPCVTSFASRQDVGLSDPRPWNASTAKRKKAMRDPIVFNGGHAGRGDLLTAPAELHCD
jgi:hypothetical protein